MKFVRSRGVKKNGGKVRTKSHVDQILIEGGRAVGVVLQGGQVIRASKAVVSNASMWDTVRLLPPEHVPTSYQKQVHLYHQCHTVQTTQASCLWLSSPNQADTLTL